MDATTLAGLRSVAAGFLPDVCTVQRPGTAVSDGAGGWTTPYTDVLVAAPCRISPAGGGDEALFAGRVVGQTDWIVTLAATTDIRLSDRLVVTVTDQSSTRTFEVVGVAGPRSYEVARRVACREAP